MKYIKKLILRNITTTYYSKKIIFGLYKLLSFFIDDELYITIQYKMKLGKKLNLNNPNSLNEKLQWLKLNYRNPLMTQCSDKQTVRKYIVDKGLGDILIKQYGVYNDATEINIDKLPNKFILKNTNGSGFNYICHDKENFQFDKIKKYLNGSLKLNGFYYSREWPYKDIKNKIICEELLIDENGSIPNDYKILCFNGEPKVVVVDKGRFTSHKRDFYDTKWHKIGVTSEYENNQEIIAKPEKLDEMIKIAKHLSKDFPFVRVDLYNVNKNIYFGELTFFPWAGYSPFEPDEYDYKFGDLLSLEGVKND